MRTDSTTPTSLPTEDASLASSCPRRQDRRAFLRDMGLAVAAALVASGMAPGEAFAASVMETAPIARSGRNRTYTIPATDGVAVDSVDQVVLARWQGRLFAFSLECPHKGATLRWQAGGQQLLCPKHKARYSPDGTHVGGRRTRDLDRFAMRRVGPSTVTVLDQVLTADQDAAAWLAAVISV